MRRPSFVRLREVPFIAGAAIGLDVEHLYERSDRVGDVERLLVGTEHDAARPRDVGRDPDGVAIRFHVVHTGSDPVSEDAQLVGEVHAAFLVDDEIFRTSKAAAFEFIGEDGLRGRDHGDLRRIPP